MTSPEPPIKIGILTIYRQPDPKRRAALIAWIMRGVKPSDVLLPSGLQVGNQGGLDHIAEGHALQTSDASSSALELRADLDVELLPRNVRPPR